MLMEKYEMRWKKLYFSTFAKCLILLQNVWVNSQKFDCPEKLYVVCKTFEFPE